MPGIADKLAEYKHKGMLKRMPKGRGKIRKVMHEFKAGTLHSGKGGPVVKSRKQAIAIALSEQRRAER